MSSIQPYLVLQTIEKDLASIGIGTGNLTTIVTNTGTTATNTGNTNTTLGTTNTNLTTLNTTIGTGNTSLASIDSKNTSTNNYLSTINTSTSKISNALLQRDFPIAGGYTNVISGVLNVGQNTNVTVDGHVNYINVDQRGNQYTNQFALKDNVIEVGSGVLSNGCQRITVATDDSINTKLSIISNGIQSPIPYTDPSDLTTYSGLVISGITNVDQVEIQPEDEHALAIAVDHRGNICTDFMKIQNASVMTDSGNKGDGCQRIVIATDDIPIALINTKLTTLNTTLGTLNTSITNLYTILNAVYTAGGASGQLRVNVIP